MFQKISFERILSETDRRLQEVKEALKELYVGKLTDEERNSFVATAYTEVDNWSTYYHSFKEVIDSKLSELVSRNTELVYQNNSLTQKIRELEVENKDLLVKLGELQARVNMMDEVISFKDGAINDTANRLDNSLFDVSEQLREALNLINENASVITQSKKVKLGNHTPAKRVGVDDEEVKELYLNGETPYSIAQRFNMTQQAIIYRLKKLGVYKERR